ncbi:MAG: aldehyde dehydrogenase family protein, partial [Pseudomonadales bacterium]
MAQMDASSQVAQLIQQAGEAQKKLETYDQVAVDELVIAAAWALINPVNNQKLSELAVAETGLGNVADKITKNHRKTLGLLRDLKEAKTVGVINRDPKNGIVEIARPVGIVGAIVPSTNPVATPMNMILNALKCRNAIIL